MRCYHWCAGHAMPRPVACNSDHLIEAKMALRLQCFPLFPLQCFPLECFPFPFPCIPLRSIPWAVRRSRLHHWLPRPPGNTPMGLRALPAMFVLGPGACPSQRQQQPVPPHELVHCTLAKRAGPSTTRHSCCRSKCGSLKCRPCRPSKASFCTGSWLYRWPKPRRLGHAF